MGSTSISAPATPEAPSTAEAIQEWVKSMPQVYETQMKYAPQEAAQQVALAQQYAQPLGEAYLSAQKAMYPEEYAMREQLMSTAKAGMAEGMPDWARESYLDTMRGELGTNAGSPIGAEYTSRGLLAQQKNWQDYYTNMALGLSGSQPVYQANSPQTSNYMSTFTPQSAMNYTAQNYGNYSNAYSSMYNTNASMANSSNQMWGNIIGGGLGGLGTFAGAKWGK